MSDMEYGEDLVERVDQAIALGEAAAGAAGLLELAAGEADGLAGEMPPAAELFDAFAYARNAGARRRLERRFRLVAPPGQPLRVSLEPGDLLVRRALGEGGLGHLALIAAPTPEPLDRALAGGWRLEGLRPGGYVLVVEAGARPHLLRDRFARRLVDARGWLPPDTLVLRPARALPGEDSAGGGRWFPREDDEDFGGLGRAARVTTEAQPAPPWAADGGWVGPGDGWNEDFGALAAETTTSVRVTVRTDFTVRGSTGVTFGWSPGEAVSRANVEIVGTAVRGMTNAAGAVTLDTTGLADGVHTVRVMHADPDRRSNDPVGPAIADPLVTPPSRIYRPLDVQITTAGGLLTNATVAAPHGGIGNRTHLDRTGDRLPIDWKPVWMRSPLKAGESTRTTADITLIVVHQPGGPQIGPVINTFLNATEAQNANYVIDANGHIIKLAEDRRAANQAGASRWGGTTWVNPFSLGIEVVHPAGGFQGVQYDALIGLLRRLQAAYPTIATHRIVGHSDIATSRTDLFTLDDRRAGDPGLDFDWPRLEAAGLGMRASLAEWTRVAANLLFRGHPYFPLREGDRDRTPGSDPRYGGVARPAVPAGVDLVRELQEDLEHIGYTIRQAGGALGRYTLATRKAVDRFQRHFFSGSRSSTRSGITLGVADANTRAWIRAVRVNIP